MIMLLYELKCIKNIYFLYEENMSRNLFDSPIDFLSGFSHIIWLLAE